MTKASTIFRVIKEKYYGKLATTKHFSPETKAAAEIVLRNFATKIRLHDWLNQKVNTKELRDISGSRVF